MYFYNEQLRRCNIATNLQPVYTVQLNEHLECV